MFDGKNKKKQDDDIQIDCIAHDVFILTQASRRAKNGQRNNNALL